MTKPRLLWVGDACVPSGFARATHYTLAGLVDQFDVTVLGLNHRGDPHPYPYPVYAASVSNIAGDYLGVGRLIWMCDLVKPDIIVLQNDPWNIPKYMGHLKHKNDKGAFSFPYHDVPVVGAIAVDGWNCAGHLLNQLDMAMFWTEFGAEEARKGGYKNPAAVIPLGVDRTIYKPMDKLAARSRTLPAELDGAFIVGAVNRNQFRKRWDLTIAYFAEFLKATKAQDAYLVAHSAPTGEDAFNLDALARWHGIGNRFLTVQSSIMDEIPESSIADFYNSLDLFLSTSQGEGFGLPAIEAMACGVPTVLPDHSAYGEWAKGAAWLTKCSTTAAMWPSGSVVGRVPDQDAVVNALRALYQQTALRENNAKAALERASLRRHDWTFISKAFGEVLSQALDSKRSAVA